MILNDDLSFTKSIESGKVQVIVLDGKQGAAHIMDAPEHGKSIIQTIDGSFKRVDHQLGFKAE
ncbi:XtrA/YqaO family protein [Bacillus sonorensis]|uniref:XtrA/YqaO family protein n=1 Tax=Bacillus sonorensis TaxID=119858 RepID=UPI0039C1A46D